MGCSTSNIRYLSQNDLNNLIGAIAPLNLWRDQFDKMKIFILQNREVYLASQEQLISIMEATVQPGHPMMISLLLKRIRDSDRDKFNSTEIIDRFATEHNKNRMMSILLASGFSDVKSPTKRQINRSKVLMNAIRQQTAQLADSDEQACIICCTYKKCVIYRTCGHVVLCPECAGQVFKKIGPKRCPICRRLSYGLQMVYQ